MRIRIIICIVIIMLFSSINVFAMDEVYVWSNNQNEVETSTLETQTEEKTGNFLRFGICQCNTY